MGDPERTVTNTAMTAASGGGERMALVLVHHPDIELAGIRRIVGDGERLSLGRRGTELGPGVLNDDRLSRAHFEVVGATDVLTVRDLDSRNGTWVDGVRVEQAAAAPGSVVSVGSMHFVVTRLPADWQAPEPEPGMVAESVAMGQVLTQARQIGPARVPALITGESGTGKELVARAIHRASGARGELLAMNCGGVDDNVLRSELFGHVKGAFTGANAERRGIIEEATRGTLLLDEIGEASAALQTSLLRVVQEGEVRRIGSNRPMAVGTRFVAATHRDLLERVERGQFREDLYARLAGWHLTIPALRTRRADILPIARQAAEEAAGRPLPLDRHLALRLLLLPWPRNVRELISTVQRLVVSQPGADRLMLDEAMLPAVKVAESAPAAAPAVPKGDRPSREALVEALRQHAYNVSACAGAFGVSRMTLYRWMKADDVDLQALRETGDTDPH